MKRIFTSVSVRLPVIVIAVLLVVAAVLGYYYNKGDANTKATALFGSLLSGLIVAVIQFAFGWADYRATEAVRSLGIMDVIQSRDERDFYRDLIEQSKTKIDVMGVTASRLMEDFASDNSGRPETNVLISALSRGVRVRILVPKDTHLLTDKDRDKYKTAATRFTDLKTKFPDKFNFVYFDHAACHSVYIVDSCCIVGPIFPTVESRHTPGIYLKSDSEYARLYIGYFEHLWNNP